MYEEKTTAAPQPAAPLPARPPGHLSAEGRETYRRLLHYLHQQQRQGPVGIRQFGAPATDARHGPGTRDSGWASMLRVAEEARRRGIEPPAVDWQAQSTAYQHLLAWLRQYENLPPVQPYTRDYAPSAKTGQPLSHSAAPDSVVRANALSEPLCYGEYQEVYDVPTGATSYVLQFDNYTQEDAIVVEQLVGGSWLPVDATRGFVKNTGTLQGALQPGARQVRAVVTSRPEHRTSTASTLNSFFNVPNQGYYKKLAVEARTRKYAKPKQL